MGSNTPRLIKGDPIFDPTSKSLKHNICIIGVVLDEFFLVQKPTISLVQIVR